ncbi:MAG TPA: hypothetical protein VLB68_00285 [Pyrinomonadaceae bacterium]|nr:hypothetical protein [Pyrinomonadaceae bacterium]
MIHLSTSQLQALCVGRLSFDEDSVASKHLATCEHCQLQFAEILKGSRTIAAFNLTFEEWFKHDHLNIDHLTGQIDQELDSESQEIIGLHLSSCFRCRANLDLLREFRQRIADPIESVTFVHPSHEVNAKVHLIIPFIRQHTLALAAMILIAIIVTSAVFMTRRFRPSSVTYEGDAISTKPVSSEAANTSGPTAPGTEILKDGPQQIIIYEDGRFEGLNQLSADARHEISLALQRGFIGRPAVLQELLPPASSLRGSSDRSAVFKQIYPLKQVIVESRPRFRWQSISGASSYQVYVMNDAGKQIVKSALLPSTKTSYVAPDPLPRGKVFQWVVIAVVNDQEIIAPAPAEPEMRFAVISATDKNELEIVNASHSSLARGVFLARTGLLAEAQIEFERLVQQNPSSELPRKLLKSLQETRRER